MVFIVLIKFQFNKERRNSKLVLLIFVFFFSLLISSVLGKDFLKSLIGNYYRADGLTTVVHLIGFSLIAYLFLDEKTFEKAPLFISLGSFSVSLLALFDNFRLYILKDLSVVNFYGVVGSTFGQPNFLAGYLLVTLPFGIYLYKVSKNKLRNIFVLSIALQTLTILLTRSWGADLGLIVLAIFWILYFGGQHRKALLFFFSFIFVLVTLVFLVEQRRIVENLPNKFIAESRERIIAKGFSGFLKRPIFGWGWANFDYAFESVDWPMHFEKDVYVDKAHSYLLEVIVTTGIVGVTIYVLLIFQVLRVLIKRRDNLGKTYLMALLIFLYHSQTNVISISEEVVFWLVLGYATLPIVNKKLI